MSVRNAKRLIIVGAGGLGREIFMFAERHPDCGSRWQMGGFLDDSPGALSGLDYPVGIIGSIRDYQPQDDDLFLPGLGKPQVRRHCCETLLKRGASFVSLIHPAAIVGRNIQMGQGIVMFPNANVTCDARIGDFTMMLSTAVAAHDTTIGNYCQISMGCDVMGAVELGTEVFLGSGARITPGIKIGAGAIVGAGCVVTRNVEPGQTVFGSVARPLPEKR